METIQPVRALLLFLAMAGMLCTACSRSPIAIQTRPASLTTTANVFDDYLKTDFEPADGFDFAVGDRDGKGGYQDQATGKSYSGWYLATHFPDLYSYGTMVVIF